MAKEAHHAGLLFGLAGALREQELLLVRSLGADIAGVRTAACQNNQRNGLISADRVRSLLRLTTASPEQDADLVSLPME
jgi:(5-formylfuran-3-yl)methyl phosphate synthase